jgi:hypothetical protein
MEGGRARRQVVVDGRGGKKAKNALAELAELRKSGGKRADKYEVKEEEAVYDEVDEDEYARIVQKRREEGGEIDRPQHLTAPTPLFSTPIPHPAPPFQSRRLRGGRGRHGIH